MPVTQNLFCFKPLNNRKQLFCTAESLCVERTKMMRETGSNLDLALKWDVASRKDHGETESLFRAVQHCKGISSLDGF